MKLIESIKKSEISLIEGDSKSGKLTFALFSTSKLNSKNPLIVSAINKSIIKKRLNNLKTIENSAFKHILETIKLYALKNNWEELKAKYGFNLLIEDLIKLIKDHSPDVLIFHRPDLMFSEIEFEYAKILLDKLITLKNELNFKLFITSDIDSLISEFSENYTDITFLTKHENSIRKIIVKNSIFPLEHYEYTFLLKNFTIEKFTEKVKEIPIPKEESSLSIKAKPKMLVISKDDYFIKMHKYLFEKYLDLSFAKTIGEVISKIMQNPDIIIYQTEEEQPDTTVCTLVKENRLNSKIIYFVNKNFIRTEDKREISFLGCYEILPKNFHLEEYIYILEKATKEYFYTKTIHKMPALKKVENPNQFYNLINMLYEQRIYFSIIKVNEYTKNIEQKLRIHDIIYKTDNIICAILIDVTKNFFKTKLENKFEINEYKIIEAIEWKENKDFCK